MSELEKIIQRKIDALDSIPDNFYSATKRAQSAAFREVLAILNSFDAEAGQIVFSTANIGRIEQLALALRASFQGGEYLEALRAYALSFEAQALINEAYFLQAFNLLEAPAEVRALVAISQQNAVALLGDSGVSQRLIQPLKDVLIQSVTTGASLSETTATLRLFIEGNADLDGKLAGYARTIADTTFSVFDRSYTVALAKDLDIQWYWYTGGKIATTRQFCCQREGHYYTRKEVESWGGKEWAGQIAGTNAETIFAFAGGWNCRHSILPVSEFSVPDSYKQKAVYSECAK